MTPREQLRAAIDLFDASDTAHAGFASAIPEVVELRRTLVCDAWAVGGDIALLDLAWVIAKAACALGPPETAPDAAEVADCCRAVGELQLVQRTRYVRIGSPWPPRPPEPYAYFMLYPGDPDRVLLLPALSEEYCYERVVAAGEVYATLRGGARVSWPPFRPPTVRALATNDYAATGLIPVELAVQGSATLPPDQRVSVGT